MKIKGKLHRITNLNTFVASFLKTGGNPTEGFTNLGKTRVHLATDIPFGKFSGGFPPTVSFKMDSNTGGEFSFDTGDELKKFRGQILAFKTTSMAPLPGMPPIPVITPIYRSAVFKFADISSREQSATKKIFIFEAVTHNDNGISQDELDDEVANLRTSLKLDKLSATILSDRVSTTAEERGGCIKFNAYVRGATSEDLGRVMDVKAGEIDFDLPGPDFITTLCVDEDDIENQIRNGLSDLSKRISAQLLAELDKEAPGLSSQATVSVWRVRFEQTGTKKIKLPLVKKALEIPVRSVVPDAAFGVPKKLF
jgi:hypothetical protein